MPSYTRNVKRDQLVFVPANSKILYGFKTKDLTAIGGISASDISALGHLTSAAASTQTGKILVVGCNAPKPPRVSKKISTAAAGTQQTVSTFCGVTNLATALGAGWNLAKQGKGVLLKAASATRGSLTVIAELSNGALYCFPMNKTDFDTHGASLGLKSSAEITTTAERDSLVRGSRVPKPGKASIELTGGGVFSSYFSTSKEGDLGQAGFNQLTEETILALTTNTP